MKYKKIKFMRVEIKNSISIIKNIRSKGYKNFLYLKNTILPNYTNPEVCLLYEEIFFRPESIVLF